jgi:hypothetical protein
MVNRLSRLLAASTAVLLAALAAGCGGIGDERKGALHDGGNHVDGIVAQPEAQIPLPDAGPVFFDTATILDAGGRDAESEEAGTATSVEAGGEASSPPPGLDGSSGPETLPTPPVTVVVLPDTQYYAAAYPEVFAGQTSWIRDQKSVLNIAAVLHVGDVVDASSSDDQWAVANSAMRKLDGLVPYVLVPGNHDTDANRKGLMDTYFGPASMPWITGTMTAGQIENNYALIDIGGRHWLVVGLEFGPRDAVLAWADTVLKAYPDRPAILLTHAYLYSDGTRYNLAVAGTDPNQQSYQYWYPAYYGFTPSQGINDGEMMWQKLVLPNPNVRLVFSGHQTGSARLSSTRPDGSVVHQMLSDYQWFNIDASDYYGGGGYLRVLQLDYGKKTIQVQTYSPYLQQYLTDDANQFTLSMNF